MVMMKNIAEARSTPSYPSMASPRYGGCVRAFLQFFDWTPAKRFSSTKRLPANKPDKAFRSSRSFRSDHGSAGKTRMMYHCQSGGNAAVLDQVPGGVTEDASTRAPGVVARFMGLDSLPEGPYQPTRHRRSDSYSGGESRPRNFPRDDHDGTPILLQDFLKRDFKTSKKTLRDRIPGIFPKRAQEQIHENRFRKKSASALAVFRCRPEVSCVSPAYIDIPTSRFLYAVAQKEKDGKQLPFLSRLPPGSQLQTPCDSPSVLKPANHLLGENIPELSLQASSTGSTVLLQGWPLASQHYVPPDLFQDDEPAASSEISFGSRPTDSASSKPLMAIGSYKVVQGRRRGSSWNGSEDSESTIDQAVHRKARVGRGEPSSESLSPAPRHRTSRSKSVTSAEPVFKTTRRPSSKSPVPKAQRIVSAGKRDYADQQPLMLQVENSRVSVSQESVSTGSLGSVSSKPPTAMAGRGKGSNTGRAGRVGASSDVSTGVTAKLKSKEDDERHLGKKMASSNRSRDVSPGKPLENHRAVMVRNQKGVAQQENSASRVFPATGSSSPVAQSGAFPDGISLPKSSVPRYGIGLFGGRKEGDHKPLQVTKKKAAEIKMGSPSPTLQRFTKKASGVAGKQTTKREPRFSSETETEVQDLGDRLKKGNVNLEDVATQSSAPSVGVTGDDADHEAILRSKRNFSNSQSKHARARSVDDVFPELPLGFESSSKVDSLTSYTCESKEELQTELESLSVNSSLNRPVERVLFGQGSPDVDFTECKNGAGDQLSSSPLVDVSGACMLGRHNSSVSLIDYDDYGQEAGMLSSSPLIDCDELRGLGDALHGSSAENEFIPIELHQVQEVDFAAGSDGLRWEDEIVETILSGRCCERSCSGPSISSQSLPSDVDDERNGDFWSSSASYNPGDCDSPRTIEITEIDVKPEALINQEHENSPPRQFVKKILEEDQLVDEAGQPSPVSILNSPFHDEACTTSESSLTDSMHPQLNSEEIVDEDLPSSSTTNVSNSDKIRQALLDISMFRSHEECTFEAKIMPTGTKDEQRFIRGVLSAAHFLSTPGSSPDWFDKDVAIDPSLFDRLETGDVEGVEFSCQASGGLWRCDRKLLFDCVNEAFGLTALWHCQGQQEVWLQEELVWRSSRPRGQKLVVEVVKKIEEWRKLASYAIDSLIERDMSVHFGNWRTFGPEVAEVGLDIESTVWGAILEEVVVDIVSTSKRY